MSQERVTTYETPANGNTTTIVHDGPSSSGGGAVWVFGIVLLLAVLAAVYFLATRSDSEAVKNNAIANAAEQVGDAATKVGTAADEAADSLTTK